MLTEIKYGTSKRCDYQDDGTPVLRIPNVSSGVINLTDLKSTDLDTNEAESLRLILGDLLMIRSNGSVQLVGMTVPVTSGAVGMAYAGYLMRLRVDPLLLDAAYLGVALASPLLRRQIEMPARSTSGVHNINTDEVRNLVLPLPPVQEQREIVRCVDAYLELAASIVDKVQAASKQIDRSLQAALDKAFRGDLLPYDSEA
jgi:type I restriction enzyme S subunit